MSTILEIKNLNKHYGTQHVLKDINLKLENFGITGLLGANGAGKSTLMKSVCGVLKTLPGTVFICNDDITELPERCKKNIGYLAENNPLYDDLYIQEYLEFICKLRRISPQSISPVMTKVGLDAVAAKKIRELSKGYKQRVGLAQALLHHPSLLILDEPTNGLDPVQIIEIRNLIKEIAKNTRVILSTHIMQEVELLCQDVIFIENGQIKCHEKLQNLINAYGSLENAFTNGQIPVS